MFVLQIDVSDRSVVDAHGPRHREYVARGFDEGRFLVAGPLVPRTGGLIIARGTDWNALQDEIRKDPYFVHGCRYEITQFEPGAWAPGLEDLLVDRTTGRTSA